MRPPKNTFYSLPKPEKNPSPVLLMTVQLLNIMFETTLQLCLSCLVWAPLVAAPLRFLDPTRHCENSIVGGLLWTWLWIQQDNERDPHLVQTPHMKYDMK